MRKKHDITETEKEEFKLAVSGVKKLTHSKISPVSQPVSPPKRKKMEEDREPVFEFSDFEKFEPVASDEIIEFARPGIQHKVLRKLRQGQYNIEAILDLHGMNIQVAKESLSNFLLNCQRNDIRHILIIHGKGRDSIKPVLKNKLNNWLRQTAHVLAFCSATSKHGRGGALYVLLKGR